MQSKSETTMSLTSLVRFSSDERYQREAVDNLLERGWLVIDVACADALNWESVYTDVFSLSGEEKAAAGKYRVCQGVPVGYKVEDTREFIECRRLSNGTVSPNFCGVLTYENTCREQFEWYSECAELLLSAVAKRLGLDERHFLDLTDVAVSGCLPISNTSPSSGGSDDDFRLSNGRQLSLSSSVLRICRYDSRDSAGQRHMFGSHTDTSFLTLALASSTPGLELFDYKDQRWLCPENLFEAGNRLVVFTGELLQVLTRHRYLAAIHRVVSFTPSVRISCPFLIRGKPQAVVSFHYFVDEEEESFLQGEQQGIQMAAVHKYLDTKRGKCFRNHEDDTNDWVLCSFPEKLPTGVV